MIQVEDFVRENGKMSYEYSIDDLWRQSVEESGKWDAWVREWLRREVNAKLPELRQGFDHLTYVDITVQVPICGICTHFEYHLPEEHRPPPDVFGADWRGSYRVLGFARSEIRAVARTLRDGSWSPRCWRCGSYINLKAGENFWINRVVLSEFFNQYAKWSHHIPPRMKKAAREVFGTTCVACRGEANSFDHILAVSKGGLTEMANIQSMCQRCNNAKADQDVEIIDVDLTFPRRPPPSDGYEGFLW